MPNTNRPPPTRALAVRLSTLTNIQDRPLGRNLLTKRDHGATGGTGRILLENALEQGHEVTALNESATGKYRVFLSGVSHRAATISREDVAAFMLAQPSEERSLHQTPVISY